MRTSAASNASKNVTTIVNPDIPMHPIRAGSSTPSRKRSRWDNGEEEDIPTHPSPKRVPKPKRSKVSNSERSSVSSQPMQQPRPRPTQPANRLHSIWVPPRTCHPPILPARSVFTYERLNQIEEGSYIWSCLSRSRYTDRGYRHAQEAGVRWRKAWVSNHRSEGDQRPHSLSTRIFGRWSSGPLTQ